MITSVKANIQAVKQFEQAASDCGDYSPKFDKGMVCIDKLYNALKDYEEKIKEKIQNLRSAQDKLDIKIKNIKEIIAKLTQRLNELKSEREDLEDELSNTEANISFTDEEGNEKSYPNPEYLALKAKISALDSEIEGVNAELYPHWCRLEKANDIAGEVSRLVDELGGVQYSLAEKENECKKLHTELETTKDSNTQKCQHAVENLKRMQQIIASYMRIKMIYNSGTEVTVSNARSKVNDINVNININMNRSNASEVQAPEPLKKSSLVSDNDIKEHGIKFDKERHIREYDGKSFGGKFNSYEDRIKGTSADDNPVLGYYMGARGESKYIPTNRSAEGIVVIDILKVYGLDGIVYRNGEPDFEVCAAAVVKIPAMSEHRDNYLGANEEVCFGNFTQADIQLAKAWNFDEREGRADWAPREVFEYRRANRLTWHEKCDTKTMVLVRTEINAYFKHIGGCSECRLRDSKTGEDEFDE